MSTFYYKESGFIFKEAPFKVHFAQRDRTGLRVSSHKIVCCKAALSRLPALLVQNRTRRMFNTPSFHFVPAPWQTEKINFSRRQFYEG